VLPEERELYGREDLSAVLEHPEPDAVVLIAPGAVDAGSE